MNHPLALSALALAVCGCAATPTRDELDPAKHQEMMLARWTEYMTPGPAHRVLDTKVGHWDVIISSFNTDPPTRSTGTSDIRWIMDHRYLQENARSSFDGVPFEGFGISGFDNLEHAYCITWVDNTGTGFVRSKGTYAPESRTFRYTSQTPDIMSGKYVKSRSVETFVDDDHMTVEFFVPGPDGKEMKSMELRYTRAR
jgi:hypothetical protein